MFFSSIQNFEYISYGMADRRYPADNEENGITAITATERNRLTG